jgi:hypothetical protein
MTIANQTFADEAAFLKEVRKLGAAEGTGAASRPEFIKKCAIASAEGVLAADTDSVGKVWTANREAANSKGTYIPEASFKQRVSELLQVVKVSKMPNVDFASTLNTAHPIIEDERKKGNIKTTVMDGFVSCARYQLAEKIEQRCLTEDEIRKAIAPKVKDKAERNEHDELVKLLKSMTVLDEGTNDTDAGPGKQAFPSQNLSHAIALIEERIADLKQAELAKNKAATAARIAAFTLNK